mmetsp:Transcript_23296/g.22884  ORF Transcript_23296/g.22884 Transcript_23296/m.22884 type:complete len:308 (-) Transcript_23296:533-1456(-)
MLTALELFEGDGADVGELLEDVLGVLVAGDSLEDHRRLLPQGRRNEDKVPIRQWTQYEPGRGAYVLILLVGGPAPALYLAARLQAIPVEPDLGLPLEVIHIINVVPPQRVHHLPLVQQKYDDALHGERLDAVELELGAELVLLGLLLVGVEGPGDLVDPELQPQVQPFERFLLQQLRNDLLVLIDILFNGKVVFGELPGAGHVGALLLVVHDLELVPDELLVHWEVHSHHFFDEDPLFLFLVDRNLVFLLFGSLLFHPFLLPGFFFRLLLSLELIFLLVVVFHRLVVLLVVLLAAHKLPLLDLCDRI